MNENFQWKPQREAQVALDALCNELLERSAFLRDIKQRMRVECGTRFFDWIDYLVVPAGKVDELLELGFEVNAQGGLEHSGAVFPRVFCRNEVEQSAEWGLGIKVDSCEEFAVAHGIHAKILGKPMGAMRLLKIEDTGEVVVCAVERHGCREMHPKEVSDASCVNHMRVLEWLRCRRRHYADREVGFSILTNMLDRAISLLGVAWAADCFFKAEREYWMQRNHAARVQKNRQDRLGLGWANHDHHTYRCSRGIFAQVVAVFEQLGLSCRERFHAGAEAGWGAQVMESTEAGIVVFADVDMSAEEVLGDFSHEGLEPSEELGTVGLWCELHGDSLFEAGMHHLECQFDFEALASGLREEEGIEVMAPFSDLPHLKQQFTKGEWWQVEGARIKGLLAAGKITAEQAEQFKKKGALGSHLENLERRDGYKGFNQQGINEIISATDPRRQG